ncbi:MAG: NADH-quinone oxidoreductase subunit NuoG [Pseudomonadota bacterium]
MPKLTIDDKEITVPEGITVIQACELAGVEIPRFCYHEKLAIAGNCRMCLVEVEKAPKPVASCAMPATEGMIVRTNTPKIQKARAGVMEFLLVNHPLDCPICDQGGECDLQDQAFKYGKPLNRFHENKRSVADKYMGPLIKTQMTRCIHCTRCIRFAQDVAGIEEMGAIGRGEHMEVTTYVEKALTSELSGNMIDICPVGALTSKPYAFKARNWELKKTESIDVMDAMGSNIRIDSRSFEVMRILPKINEDVNEEWISDKSRFSYDGLKAQRIDRPYVKINGALKQSSYQEALEVISSKLKGLKGEEIGAIAGTLSDAETLHAMKQFMVSLGSKNIDANQFGYKFDLSARGNYLFNTTIAGIENADLCLLIGANPREVAPVLNVRIGRCQRSGKMKVARVGGVDDQTYKIEELGSDISILSDIANEKHEFSAKLKEAKNPMIIIGDAVLVRSDSLEIQSLVHSIVQKYNILREDWNGLNILHNHASMVGALDIGFVPTDKSKTAKQMAEGKLKMLFLLGADEIDVSKLSDCFVVYIGHHGDKSANIADVVLPSAAYTEKDAIYINLEGRVQVARAAVEPPGDARADWKIIADLAEACGYNLGFKDLDSLRHQLAGLVPALRSIGTLSKEPVRFIEASGKILPKPLSRVAMNFYMTDPISRASVTMAKCTEVRRAVTS